MVSVEVKVLVGVFVIVGVGVEVPVLVGVFVGPLGVLVMVGVGESVGVKVCVAVRVLVTVGLSVGVDVAELKMGLTGTAISRVQPAKNEIAIEPVKKTTEKKPFKILISHLIWDPDENQE